MPSRVLALRIWRCACDRPELVVRQASIGADTGSVRHEPALRRGRTRRRVRYFNYYCVAVAIITDAKTAMPASCEGRNLLFGLSPHNLNRAGSGGHAGSRSSI